MSEAEKIVRVKILFMTSQRWPPGVYCKYLAYERLFEKMIHCNVVDHHVLHNLPHVHVCPTTNSFGKIFILMRHVALAIGLTWATVQPVTLKRMGIFE